VWHLPRSNWKRRDSTGTHSTLRLTESGTVSVDCARFKSPLAHSIINDARLVSPASRLSSFGEAAAAAAA
jgi:hypothetical protein